MKRFSKFVLETKLKEKTECPKCEGKGCDHCDGKGYHDQNPNVDEAKLAETLSPSEKKLVNQMYDKKGKLTPLGKKVMNHGKKPGDKGYIDEVKESGMKSYYAAKASAEAQPKSKVSLKKAPWEKKQDKDATEKSFKSLRAGYKSY